MLRKEIKIVKYKYIKFYTSHLALIMSLCYCMVHYKLYNLGNLHGTRIFMMIHAATEILSNEFRCVLYEMKLNEAKIRSRRTTRSLSWCEPLHYLKTLTLHGSRKK